MKTLTLRLLILFSILLSITWLSAASQQGPSGGAQTLALSQQMPFDPQITIGKLPNGLQYYVRSNKKPEKRAELRLVVKAGSILEDEDQQGLAHFVEHMAFNGTQHFPKNDIVQFIESLGMRFGADLNAYTSFDETVYMLQVPTDKPEVMDKALLVLEDWAHNVSFDPIEVDKERGVVMEEWRRSRGAGARINDKLFPVVLKGSRYAARLPIGKTEIIQNAKAETMKKFYTDWYRPDLMAVVAVGDIDKGAVENLITEHFARIQQPPSPRARTKYSVPDHEGSIYAINTDKEQTATTVSIENLLPARPWGSVEVYREHIVDRLFSAMLSARLSELARTPNAPFLSAGTGRGTFIGRDKEEAVLSARVKDDGIERGIDALLTEVERVAKFGFTSTELDRVKQNTLRSYERIVIEDQNRVSNSRADEYVRNFLTNETLPTGELEQALQQRFIPEITLGELNKIAKEWFTDRNRIVTVVAPEKAGINVPDEAKLSAVIKAAPNKDLKAYVDTIAGTTLLAKLPNPGSVVKATTKDEVGITEWELSNGVKVVLKPTTFREDEILFRATSPGGTSLASDEDFIPASSAATVVSAGGIGEFSASDLRKFLTGKVASANVNISDLSQGLSGTGSRRDLETMFQLIYMRFTQPRADTTAFSVQTSQLKTSLANQTAAPTYAFNEALTNILSQNHLRRRMTTPATIDQWNLDKSLAFYKDRFADASGFTFFFVGSFDLATMKPFVERYLGSLPSIHRQETWKDVGVRLPKGVIEKRVEKGIEPKSQTQIVFSGPFQYDPSHRVAMAAMTHILQVRLLETIREELGGTYSITAGGSGSKNPIPQFQVNIQFGSAPERTDDLVKRVFDEIQALKSQGPTEKQLNDEKEALSRSFETNIKQNAQVLSQITAAYEFGEDAARILDVPNLYKKLDAANIQQAARTYLDTANYVRVSLYPEKK
jgi:zinc protease